jgi:hypothetical protein
MQTKVIAIGVAAILILGTTCSYYGGHGLMFSPSQTQLQLSYAWTDPNP